MLLIGLFMLAGFGVFKVLVNWLLVRAGRLRFSDRKPALHSCGCQHLEPTVATQHPLNMLDRHAWRRVQNEDRPVRDRGYGVVHLDLAAWSATQKSDAATGSRRAAVFQTGCDLAADEVYWRVVGDPYIRPDVGAFHFDLKLDDIGNRIGSTIDAPHTDAERLKVGLSIKGKNPADFLAAPASIEPLRLRGQIGVERGYKFEPVSVRLDYNHVASSCEADPSTAAPFRTRGGRREWMRLDRL